ncbi:MAG: hypothetical protein KDI83_16875 [Gammaproteobacteria bacterium]|nr:hypothetical protein [Gammaproteobacteria bacterium]
MNQNRLPKRNLFPESAIVPNNFNHPPPQPKSARLLALLNADVDGKNRVDFSAVLARQEIGVCLIAAGAPIDPRLSLQELVNGDEPTKPLPPPEPDGVLRLSAGECLSRFSELDSRRQSRLIKLICQLESTFDYIIIETESEPGAALPRIFQAASLMLLAVAPTAESLAYAFELLRTIRKEYTEKHVQVLLIHPGALPSASGTFNRLEHVASRYLQMEIGYLGHLDPADAGRSEAVVTRFCAATRTIQSATRLSDHLCGLCPVEFTAGKGPSVREAGQVSQPEANALHPFADGSQERRDQQSLRAAILGAALLAEREALD